MRTLAMTVWMMVAVSPAQAAVYCVDATGMGPQCYYQDARECRKDARAAQGACMVDRASIAAISGMERFCLVLPDGFAQCHYADANTCERDARRNNGICMNNTLQNHKNSPYRFEMNTVN